MVVFCGEWGIWWWRQSVWDVLVGSLRTNHCEVPSVEDWRATCSSNDLPALRQGYLERGVPHYVDMDILMSGIRPAHQQKGLMIHQWNYAIAYGSLCTAGEGNLVCSPEFCFLQICGAVRRMVPERLPNHGYIVILAELGCELCGTYSRQNTHRGHKKRRNPISCTASMLSFLGRMAFAYGASRMQDVLPWIADGLASPMETALYLLLCLPRTWGGVGIMRPVVNAQIDVPEYLRSRVRQSVVFPDLLWPESSLVVEYDSDEDHMGREREDQERRELLQDMGYVVIVFHSDDVMDVRKFNNKAASILSHIGRAGLSLPATNEQFYSLQAALRSMLLKRSRWI